MYYHYDILRRYFNVCTLNEHPQQTHLRQAIEGKDGNECDVRSQS